MHRKSFNMVVMSSRISLHDDRLGLRVAPEVKQAAQRAAAARGLSISDWLRLVIERAAAEPAPANTRPRPQAPPRLHGQAGEQRRMPANNS